MQDLGLKQAKLTPKLGQKPFFGLGKWSSGLDLLNLT